MVTIDESVASCKGATMSKYELAKDEVVILETGAARESISNSGTLTLTNYCLVFSWTTGFFKTVDHHIAFPLSDIKVFNGQAQVKASKPTPISSFYYPLTFFFTDTTEVFLLPPETKKSIGDWVESTNELVTGTRQGFNPEDIGAVDVSKKLSDAFSALKPVTTNFAEAAQPLVGVASAAVSASPKWGRRASIASAVLNAVETYASSNDNPNSTAPSSFAIPQAIPEATGGSLAQDPAQPQTAPSQSPDTNSLDEQVEVLRKLKSLVDDGILTQEEFENKKRQILGL